MTVYGSDLYVTEQLSSLLPSESRIDEFNASPGFEFVAELPQSQMTGLKALRRGIAFGTSTDETEMYLGVEQPDSVATFKVGSCGGLECASFQQDWTGAHTPEGSFSQVRGVAVDGSTVDWASGDVFVIDNREQEHVHVVDIFKPEAEGKEPKEVEAQLTGLSPSEPFEFLEFMTVSGLNGDVIIDNGGAVDLFAPTSKGHYSFIRKLPLPPLKEEEEIKGTAVDGGNGEIYVATTGAIYEFDAAGNEIVGEITGDEAEGEFKEFGKSYHPLSIAVDAVAHRVFVSVFDKVTEEVHVDVFSGDVVTPDVTTGTTSNLELERASGKWGVKLTGTVDPDGAGPDTCWFVWGSSSLFGERESCSGEGESEEDPVQNGSVPVSVHANLGGLAPDTRYYYRLQAKNANGTNPGEESQDEHFTTPGPGLESESVAEVSSTGAKLRTSINPHDAPSEEHDLQEQTKSPTTYYFEYGTSQCTVSSSCSAIPLAPASIGSGVSTVEVEQQLEGLSPNTTYHYRVVAANESLPQGEPGVIDEFNGPEQTFTTQPAASPLRLADGRAWELVSPVDMRGGSILPPGTEDPQQASVNGNEVTWSSTVPIESEPQGNASGQILSTREPQGGWSSVNIAMPHSVPTGGVAGHGGEFRFFSEDLSASVTEPFGRFSRPLVEREHEVLYEDSPVATERTPYLRHDASCASERMGCYEPLLTSEDVTSGIPFGGPASNAVGEANFVSATPDGGHAVLSSQVALLKGEPISGPGALYEWSAGGLQPVSVLPDGELVGQSTLGGVGGGGEYMLRDAISDNGQRVFFSTSGRLYLRDTSGGKTLRLDTPQGGSGTLSDAQYQIANADGSKVFFTDSQQLTADGAKSGDDLYECAIEEPGSGPVCNLRDLTPVPAKGLPGAGEPADVLGEIPGISENGEYVYFVANGVQAQGASPGDCGQTSSGTTCNLYVEHDGTTMFIATLSGDDTGDWNDRASRMTARVSPNGQWLAFMSDRSLTGYDNHDVVSGEPDEEVYLFDAARAVSLGVPGVADNPVCVSCDPSGAQPAGVEYERLKGGLISGNEVWSGSRWIASSVPGWTPYELKGSLSQPRYLSDGGRLFFDSSDALVPQDSNGEEDVYEFEPVGEGDCSSSSTTFVAAEGGCVGLISSGVARGESAFLDASASGGDVFFLTSGGLVPEDVDGTIDLYDAHECVVPCPPLPGLEPPECNSASTCRPGGMSQPTIFGPPASATLEGPGNVTTPVYKPASKPSPTSKQKPPSQKLADALKACAKKKRHQRRVLCERQARERYGPAKSRKKNASTKSKKSASKGVSDKGAASGKSGQGRRG